MLAALLDRSTASDDDDVLMWLPGSWADERATGGGLVLNPSYLAPAWFRVFHEVTGDPRWLRLADSSYVVLQAVCGEGPRALPVVPDWIRWHSAAKWALRGSDEPTSSWDAVRVPWRIGTDRLWFGAPAARSFLDGCMRPYLARREHQGLAVEMSADGRVLGSQDHALANAMYSFAASTDPVRDRLIERVARQAVWTGPDTLRFGDGRHYYVESLAYLPFLARTNAYNPR
jgi:endoglucanase